MYHLLLKYMYITKRNAPCDIARTPLQLNAGHAHRIVVIKIIGKVIGD